MCSLGWDVKARGGQILNRENVTLPHLHPRNHVLQPSLCLFPIHIQGQAPGSSKLPGSLPPHFPLLGTKVSLASFAHEAFGEGVLGQPGPLGGGFQWF